MLPHSYFREPYVFELESTGGGTPAPAAAAASASSHVAQNGMDSSYAMEKLRTVSGTVTGVSTPGTSTSICKVRGCSWEL